ncbi:hypothetical protein Tco_0453129 [Tanacetum coccineum]
MSGYDYRYLEEIEVRRDDHQLYEFKEGDFPRLYLHDIEDMLLFLVQKKLFNLERDVIFDLFVALRMFTRHIVILKQVEDLQLGVESYQKNLNITKPETFRNRVNTYAIRNTKLLFGIEDSHHGPSDAMHNPSPATQEHQSDTLVFTMTMEILPEPTSNKLCDRERLAQLRNPVKEVLRNST